MHVQQWPHVANTSRLKLVPENNKKTVSYLKTYVIVDGEPPISQKNPILKASDNKAK